MLRGGRRERVYRDLFALWGRQVDRSTTQLLIPFRWNASVMPSRCEFLADGVAGQKFRTPL